MCFRRISLFLEWCVSPEFKLLNIEKSMIMNFRNPKESDIKKWANEVALLATTDNLDDMTSGYAESLINSQQIASVTTRVQGEGLVQSNYLHNGKSFLCVKLFILLLEREADNQFEQNSDEEIDQVMEVANQLGQNVDDTGAQTDYARLLLLLNVSLFLLSTQQTLPF
jgi:hypothetical protein